MNRLNIEYRYDIGDKVYFNCPDGDCGVVTNVSYNLRENSVLYLVSFGRFEADAVWCYAEELSETKVF